MGLRIGWGFGGLGVLGLRRFGGFRALGWFGASNVGVTALKGFGRNKCNQHFPTSPPPPHNGSQAPSASCLADGQVKPSGEP